MKTSIPQAATSLRKVEMIAGFATIVLALLNPSTFMLGQFVLSTSDTQEKLLAVLSSVVTFIGPAILVTIGSYSHAVRQRRLGLVLALVGGVILIVMGFLAFLGGLVYVFGPWRAALTLLPPATATVTLIAALFVHFRKP